MGKGVGSCGCGGSVGGAYESQWQNLVLYHNYDETWRKCQEDVSRSGFAYGGGGGDDYDYDGGKDSLMEQLLPRGGPNRIDWS